jgi:hypothetical protein
MWRREQSTVNHSSLDNVELRPTMRARAGSISGHGGKEETCRCPLWFLGSSHQLANV